MIHLIFHAYNLHSILFFSNFTRAFGQISYWIIAYGASNLRPVNKFYNIMRNFK